MQQIRIDFDNPGLPQSLGAVEGESQSRIFQAALYKSGAAYTAPAGAVYSIMYRGFGPQNQGWYDTIEDGAGKRAACTVSGNVVTCELARQALRVPGHLTVVLCVSDAKGKMLKSWPIMADVRNDGYEDTVEVESFFYITQITSAEWDKAFAAWEDFKATIDPTLTLSGKAADAKATGTAVNKEKERARKSERDLEDKKADKTDLDVERKRIDTLNEGGLNLKDEVIDTSIKAWLADHPEATTTVQDGAITERKINAEFLNYIKKDYVTPEMFGAIGDGITDDTDAFKNGLGFLTNGGVFLLTPKKSYKVTDAIDVPQNVSIQGLIAFSDVSGKASNVNAETVNAVTTGMSTILIDGNGQFLLHGNNTISRICVLYPNQNYNIKTVEKSVTNPDGLENFVEYKPTFLLRGNNIGLILRDIIYLGGYSILYCGSSVNPEKLLVDNIIGMCVGTAFTIMNSKDIMRFKNITMNSNSLKPFIQGVNSGSDINFYTKCAKNSVVFSFGGVNENVRFGCDGSIIDACFAYGVKRFIELNGEGNSLQISNSGADMCHEFLYINSTVKPFGTFLSNCFVIPTVYKAIVDGKESERSPAFIRIENGASDHKINVVNAKIFGGGNNLITDSSVCDYVLWCGNDNLNTRIDLVNVNIDMPHNLQLGFNKIGSNNIDQNGVNYNRVLTCTNVIMNGYTQDTNINKSKVIRKEIKVTDGGLTEFSDIGFLPSSVTISAWIDGEEMSSLGVSDGTVSYCSANMSGDIIGSGGTAIVIMLGIHVTDRIWAEMNSFTEKGFKLKWKKYGELAPIDKTIQLLVSCTR